ncbi:EAL domain-containing protein [Listeria costaricensis]|uniref:EAL domain-containing protein n=1 Tax=Listeria costaricensis TaxID=2026604 RepID=UPI000C084720|nr:EAL domain-containing protein [Listeria costaricensis]
MTRAIRSIIEQNLLDTVYEPIVNIQTQEIFGYESLTRLQDQQIFKNIRAFITACEAAGLRYEFELQTLLNAIHRFPHKDGRIFINISYDTFLDHYVYLQQLLETNGQVTFEFLETSILPPERMAELHQKIQPLRTAYDTFFAIDDFGSGYADVDRILSHSADFVKTDTSLLQDLLENPGKQLVIQNLHHYLEKNGQALIVEGVETKEQLDYLVQLGIHYAQGYYFN